ncbi:MAG: alpha-glucosidase [Propionibacteriaceae bacterium]|nr:alpha-glucosidase [Propionibacteriaceae bacterium]
MFRRTPEWWRSAVVYQIYPRSFADSNGDGIGDLPGIVGRLDYLATLGVDVIWLSPVYASPQDDNGYDISDYQAIDPMFGTLDDMDELIAAAHDRGIGVVMDLVVNHTSDEHPWFQESRDPASGKRDWYIWRPARPGHVPGEPGAEPFNHGSVFGGSAWCYDERSGEYYLHVFSRKQPDLNWDNPEVRQAVYAMMRWWLDRGIDGFRMDVINMISKPQPRDGHVAPGETYAWDVTPIDGPRIHEFLREMHAEVFAGRDLLTVGEMPGTTPERALVYTDPANREVNMVFQFEHMDIDTQPGKAKWAHRPLRLPELKASLGRWQDVLGDVGWNSLYWNNHDQPRIVSRWGDDSGPHRVASAKALATVLHLHKGTPYIYQGEELGMTNAGFTEIGQYRDIESLNAYADALASGADPADMLESLAVKSRDNARTPMQWDASRHAGFTTGEPWLPVTGNYAEINAASQVGDPESVFAHYRRLIGLRHDHEIVRLGRFDLLEPGHEQVYAFTRTLGDQRWLVVANLSSRSVRVPDSIAGFDVTGEILVSNPSGQPGTLAPWESRVLSVN